MHPSVRAYHPLDLAAVRAIACDTADRGDPVEPLLDDRQLVADLLTGYYTRYEPSSLWIADCDGEVVGYLTGCLDSRRFRRVMACRVVPPAVLSAIGRGGLLRHQSWRWLWSSVHTTRLGGIRDTHLAEYPAHLHLNIRQEFRGRGLGRLLLERFLEQARSQRVHGTHATVRFDNASSRRFFEYMGFEEIGRYPVVVPYGQHYERHETVVFGKSL